MSPEFAGAMVTVIPIIILLASAEIGALLNRRQQNQERIDGLVRAARERCVARIQAGQAPDVRDLEISRGAFPYDRESSRVTIFYWIVSGVLALVAEWLLIYWLAAEERPKSGALTYFIAVAALNGFYMVLMGVGTLVADGRAYDKVLKANSQPMTFDPALAPWLIAPQTQRVPASASDEA
ncbi:hypothetical protein [Streptomyces sp. NPDC056463]|uniref:hypothetical protein n=1 Tax=Streptomyces sp. NPDC056463 TaxID=3345827 RepID=UPI003695EFCE